MGDVGFIEYNGVLEVIHSFLAVIARPTRVQLLTPHRHASAENDK